MRVCLGNERNGRAAMEDAKQDLIGLLDGRLAASRVRPFYLLVLFEIESWFVFLGPN